MKICSYGGSFFRFIDDAKGRRLDLRPLQAADLGDVLAIQLRCHDSTRIESAQSFDAKRRASPTSCFMARLEGQSVGYLVAIPVKAGQPPPLNASTCPVPRDADALYLHDLAVLPELGGQGMAARLLRTLWQGAQSRGLQRAALVSVQGSQGFWQHHGYAAYTLQEIGRAHV